MHAICAGRQPLQQQRMPWRPIIVWLRLHWLDLLTLQFGDKSLVPIATTCYIWVGGRRDKQMVGEEERLWQGCDCSFLKSVAAHVPSLLCLLCFYKCEPQREASKSSWELIIPWQAQRKRRGILREQYSITNLLKHLFRLLIMLIALTSNHLSSWVHLF